MLPLATSVLPNPAPPPPSVANPGQASFSSVQTDAAAAARQQLPIAVSSTGAPAAYSPDTLQSRQAQTERRIAPLPGNFFNNQPIKLLDSLSSQFTAQFLAQETSPPVSQPGWRSQPVPVKTGLNRARGEKAYGIAVARNSQHQASVKAKT